MYQAPCGSLHRQHLRHSADASVIAFQASYPNVRIQILVTDRFVDHIIEGVDLGVQAGASEGLVTRLQVGIPDIPASACGEPGLHEGLQATKRRTARHRLLSFSMEVG